MASAQYFIYNTDDGGYVKSNRVFTLNKNQQILIRSAGLTTDLVIYQMVGICKECSPEDVIWEPVTYCGSTLTLGSDDTRVWIMEPGTYSVGDPTDNTLLTGDVNITGERFTGVDSSSVGKSNCNPEPNPLLPVETAMAELGCIISDGEMIGKVILCKLIDENTGVQTVTQTAYFEDGTIISDYTGPWEVCTPDVCQSEPFIGVITDLTILQN